MEEHLVSASPQLSFNFGSGHGWSYISGGIGRSVWALHETGLAPSAADVEPLGTVNYGVGARWFAKNHLAFSFDVRFYQIQAGTPIPPAPGSPAPPWIEAYEIQNYNVQYGPGGNAPFYDAYNPNYFQGKTPTGADIIDGGIRNGGTTSRGIEGQVGTQVVIRGQNFSGTVSVISGASA